MKKGIVKILYKLLILGLLFSILIIYCEVKLREIPSSYIIKKNYFEKNLDSAEILILGSSQPLYGINPEYFSLKGFNLAEQSQSLYYDEKLVSKYIDKMPNLKFVFITISYFSLWYELYNSVENWRDYFYKKDWQLAINNQKYIDKNDVSYIDLYGISFVQSALLVNFNLPAWTESLRENGWYQNTGRMLISQNADSSSALEIKRQDQAMADSVFENNKNYLEKLITELTLKKITPVIIITPVYNTYSMKMDPNRNKKTEEVINNLCKAPVCRSYIYLNDPRFVLSDFSDTDHLNETGAGKFSKIINKEIISDLKK